MRNFSNKTALWFVTVILGLCFIGCSPPPPKAADIQGKWVAVKKVAYKLGGGGQVGFVIEFFDNKTVKMPSGLGSWDILPDGRVKIEIPQMIMLGSLKGNVLTITMPHDQGKVIFDKQ